MGFERPTGLHAEALISPASSGSTRRRSPAELGPTSGPQAGRQTEPRAGLSAHPRGPGCDYGRGSKLTGEAEPGPTGKDNPAIPPSGGHRHPAGNHMITLG